MTFRELKSQLGLLNQKQLNQEVYIRFIDNKQNLYTIQLVNIEKSNKGKSNLNWAWLFAEILSIKQKHQLNNQEDFIVRPIKMD